MKIEIPSCPSNYSTTLVPWIQRFRRRSIQSKQSIHIARGVDTPRLLELGIWLETGIPDAERAVPEYLA
jgi:hypothetical protein